MSPKWISHLRTAPLRRATDRLSRVMVSGGGVLVLLALLLIFCYLLWVVPPLFRSPAVSGAAALATYQAPTASAMTPQSPLVSAGSVSPSISPPSPAGVPQEFAVTPAA